MTLILMILHLILMTVMMTVMMIVTLKPMSGESLFREKRQIKKKFNYAIYYSVCMMQLDSTDSNESLCHIKIQSSRKAFSLF